MQDCKEFRSHYPQFIILWKDSGSNGKISVPKGHGLKPLLNANDHRALRWYCLRNRHATMMDITRGLGSTLENHGHSTHSAAASTNATCNYIMQRGRHLFILCRKATELSGSKVIWDGPKDSGNMFSCLTSPHVGSFFREKRPLNSTCQRWKRPSRLTNEKLKNQPMWWYGGASVPMHGHGWSAWTVHPEMCLLQRSGFRLATLPYRPWLVESCRDGCPSGRFSSLHRGTLELWPSGDWSPLWLRPFSPDRSV